MAQSVQDQAELIRMTVALADAFNPSGPVARTDLFAGRVDQLSSILSAVGQAGQHAILYGDRGVGKTSLAGLAHQFWANHVREYQRIFPIRYSCDSEDTFGTVWQNVAELISDHYEIKATPRPKSETWRQLFEAVVAGEASPHSVRRLLALSDQMFIIVIDEFDQITDEHTVQTFASTIKALSDFLVDATLILVGVADTVDDLIGDHESIDRALAQVHMPPMSTDELNTVIRTGYDRVGFTVDEQVLELMGRLAQGLPHYAHRIGQEAGYSAIERSTKEVEKQDVETALKKAVQLTNESIRNAYSKAITSPQKALYDKVLLACALAQVDDLGYFAPSDVREPLAGTANRMYSIPQFVGHLKKFTTEARSLSN